MTTSLYFLVSLVPGVERSNWTTAYRTPGPHTQTLGLAHPTHKFIHALKWWGRVWRQDSGGQVDRIPSWIRGHLTQGVKPSSCLLLHTCGNTYSSLISSSAAVLVRVHFVVLGIDPAPHESSSSVLCRGRGRGEALHGRLSMRGHTGHSSLPTIFWMPASTVHSYHDRGVITPANFRSFRALPKSPCSGRQS